MCKFINNVIALDFSSELAPAIKPQPEPKRRRIEIRFTPLSEVREVK